MQYVNSIPLNGTITVYTPSGAVDMYNKPTSWTKSEVDAAIFKKTQHSRDNFQREVKYNNVVYTKDIIDKDSLIYLGTTTETDPESIGAVEVQDFSPMEDVFQVVRGYKIWL